MVAERVRVAVAVLERVLVMVADLDTSAALLRLGVPLRLGDAAALRRSVADGLAATADGLAATADGRSVFVDVLV